MPNPWLNVHKSTAAMNCFFSNMTNTVIVMSATQRLFRLAPFTYEYEYWLFTSSKFHVRGGREHPSGKTPDECFFISEKNIINRDRN